MTTQTETAILAGGCFWGMEALLRRLPGVLSTRVGYTGGDVSNATYLHHGTHAEALEVVFDPRQIAFRRILEFFFQIHDPTTTDRQGNDVGSSYRSAIFYRDNEQKRVAESTVADVDGSGLWPGEVTTEIVPCGPFLGGGAGTSGLPRAPSERIHMPLRSTRLEASRPLTGAAASPSRHSGHCLRTWIAGRMRLEQARRVQLESWSASWWNFNR